MFHSNVLSSSLNGSRSRRCFEATCYPHLERALGPRRCFKTACCPSLPMLSTVFSLKWGECVHRNVGIRLPIAAASRNRRSVSSTRRLRKFVRCDCELAAEQNLRRPGQVSVRFVTGTLPRRRVLLQPMIRRMYEELTTVPWTQLPSEYISLVNRVRPCIHYIQTSETRDWRVACITDFV
jgi:hypothetical protein